MHKDFEASEWKKQQQYATACDKLLFGSINSPTGFCFLLSQGRALHKIIGGYVLESRRQLSSNSCVEIIKI